MKKITKEILAKEAHKTWIERFPNDKDGIGVLLFREGDKITPEQVNKIIGNDSWTRVPNCSECKQTVDEVVMIGDDPDYESETAWVCKKCLKLALAI